VLKYLRPYFLQKCKQAAATSEFVVSDISHITDVGGLLSLLPIFVYVCVTLLVCYSVGARASALACVRASSVYMSKTLLAGSLNLRLGVQRSPLLMTGQRKPSVSLLFPRTVFAFQIIMITEGSVQTRWIQTNTKKTFRFGNSSRLAYYIVYLVYWSGRFEKKIHCPRLQGILDRWRWRRNGVSKRRESATLPLRITNRKIVIHDITAMINSLFVETKLKKKVESG